MFTSVLNFQSQQAKVTKGEFASIIPKLGRSVRPMDITVTRAMRPSLSWICPVISNFTFLFRAAFGLSSRGSRGFPVGIPRLFRYSTASCLCFWMTRQAPRPSDECLWATLSNSEVKKTGCRVVESNSQFLFIGSRMRKYLWYGWQSGSNENKESAK